MELCSILHFLENKSILIIGATGFLAKVLIEKILRVQPNVKKLYLLLRAADSTSALHRFDTEVISKELFKVVKDKYGANWNSMIKEKVSLIAGDITLEGLGIKDSTLQDEMKKELDVVINSAATTDFDGRYDVAFGINTMGAANILNFSKQCTKLRVLLHVSTAYVCGEREGLILEKPFILGETLNGKSKLNINLEKEILEEKLNELQEKNTSEKEIASYMKDFGIQRAKECGWPNTYIFTKAMGEMLLLEHDFNNEVDDHNKMSLVIIRPTIITSTYKEPFPGWLEGVRNIDSFVVGHGTGKLSCFPGDPSTVVDLIPVDMVVNATIVAMVYHANQLPRSSILHHVGSSIKNPITYDRLQEYGFRYFTENPWVDKQGKPVVVHRGTRLSTFNRLHAYTIMRFLVPLKILGVLNMICCNYFQGAYLDLSRKVKLLMRLIELFSPYVFFRGVFDDMNTEKLRRASTSEHEMFYFDPKNIDWDDYFMYTHIAGVVRYAFR